MFYLEVLVWICQTNPPFYMKGPWAKRFISSNWSMENQRQTIKKKQEEKIKKDYSNWSMEHNGEKNEISGVGGADPHLA